MNYENVIRITDTNIQSLCDIRKCDNRQNDSQLAMECFVLISDLTCTDEILFHLKIVVL